LLLKGAHYAFSETDFTEDLKKFNVPTRVLHVKGATLKVYPGFPHGMPTTNADQINANLLAFIKQSQQVAA
jgi:non-heme chloroperoxidase